VVASGQVRYQSLARIGAEITGTVEQRHVREGDQVAAGDLLVSLQADDLQAQFEQAQTALDQLRNQLYPQAVHTLQEARLAWQQAEREAQRRTQLARDDMLAPEQAEQADIWLKPAKLR
jgi:HlyD family secretion protein